MCWKLSANSTLASSGMQFTIAFLPVLCHFPLLGITTIASYDYVHMYTYWVVAGKIIAIGFYHAEIHYKSKSTDVVIHSLTGFNIERV